MAKPTGAEFAAQGAKYIGTPYTEMDCQAFVERMLADVGVHKDWKGSNAMYRDMAWVGDVDECIAKYGRVPVGALLFIHAMDGGEEARGYHDGLGNASHVGVYTGVGQGAIHSSSSRGCVAQSRFASKAIPGGWNKVGLLHEVDYGLNENESEAGNMNAATATVTAANGKPVNFRKKPQTKSAAYGSLPVGTTVEVVENLGEWTRVCYAGNTGYIMSKFLTPAAGGGNDGAQTLLAKITTMEERMTALENRMDRLEAPEESEAT